jgi:hypothetical protein
MEIAIFDFMHKHLIRTSYASRYCVLKDTLCSAKLGDLLLSQDQ